MKILIASDMYKPDINGVALVAQLQCEELRRRGIEARVIALTDEGRSYCTDGIYYFDSYRDRIYPDWKKTRIRKHPLLDELIQWKPDIIHIHSEGTAATLARKVAKANNTPYVMTSHTDYAKYVFGKYDSIFPIFFIMRVLGVIAYRGSEYVILPSEKAGTFQQNRYIKRKTVHIPNGIDMKKYQKPVSDEEKKEIMAKYGIKDNDKILLVVSRLSHEKRIQDLISFMPELLKSDPEIQLIIVGGGPYTDHLKEQAKKLGLTGSVIFTGMVQPEQVYKLYSIGTVFVSASDFEVHSLTYIEASACGLPLLCLDDPCLKDVLFDGVNGHTFKGQEDFCRYALQMIGDKELNQKMRENALRIAENFGEKAFVDKMLDVYNGILKKRETAGKR